MTGPISASLDLAQNSGQELKSTLNGLLGLRDNLTGKKREVDDTVIKTSRVSMTLWMSKNLNKYVRKLVAERNALDEDQIR
uniref:Uncharacterized protein n=1 Tax=Ditylenchus dipsaci TaxID=166011 RepID=A0A915CXM5_9BILA